MPYLLRTNDLGASWRLLAVPPAARWFQAADLIGASQAALVPGAPPGQARGPIGEVWLTADRGTAVRQGTAFSPDTTISFASPIAGFAWNPDVAGRTAAVRDHRQRAKLDLVPAVPGTLIPGGTRPLTIRVSDLCIGAASFLATIQSPAYLHRRRRLACGRRRRAASTLPPRRIPYSGTPVATSSLIAVAVQNGGSLHTGRGLPRSLSGGLQFQWPTLITSAAVAS